MDAVSFVRLSRACFACVLLIVVAVLCGWHWDFALFKSGMFGATSTMKVNTAIGLAVTTFCGFLLVTNPAPGSLRLIVTRTLSSVVIFFAFLILSEHILKLNFGIDEFFVKDPESLGTRWVPGRPSIITSILLIIVGTGAWALSFRTRFARRLAHTLLLIAWIVAFQSLLTYIEGVHVEYGLAIYTQAIYTAISFVILCTGLILMRPEEGLMKIVSGDTDAGRIGRLLLFSAILVPPIIAWVQKEGVAWGLWNVEFGTVLRILAQVVFFAWIAFRTGMSLLDSEFRERRSKASLRSAIQTRDDFLSIASHELRTPLTSMTLHTQMIKRRLAKNDPTVSAPEYIAKTIERTEAGLTRMARLVDDMLDVSRIDQGRLTLTLGFHDLSLLIERMIAEFRDQLREAEVTLSFEAAEPRMCAVDSVRLEQVFTNLFTNVLRYAAHAPLRIQVNNLPSSVQVIFEDEGPGIPLADQERIFYRYERLISANEVSGLGLGLFITRKIVEAHRGDIYVEKKSGRGTRFIVSLPWEPAK